MSFYQSIYDALRGSASVPERTALVLSSRAAGRRLLASTAAACGMLLGVSAETPYSLAAELCAPQLMEPDAPRLMDDDEAAELLMSCVVSRTGLFSEKNAGTLGAVREIARNLSELNMEEVPPLTQQGKQAELQKLRKAYAAKKKQQRCWDRADLFAAAIEQADAAPKLRCVTLPGVRFTALERKLLARISDGGVQCAALEVPKGLRSPYLAPEGAYPEVLDRRNIGNTRILACMGEELETERVLRDMLERGLSFDLCAVVYPTATYAPMLYETAGQLGIPAVFPSGIPVRETRVYAALRLLSELHRRFSEAEDIRKLLVSFGCMSGGAPHALAQQLREYRVGWGKRSHYLSFLRHYREDTDANEKLTPEQKKQRLAQSEHWEKWLEAVFTLSEPGKASLSAQKKAMVLFLGGSRVNAAERAAAFTVTELTRHVRALPKGTRLVDWLLQLLEGKNVLSENTAPGKLLCLPLRQALTCGRKHIYVLGLARDVFAPGVESPVLLDAERDELNTALGCELPLRRSIGEEKRLRFLELLLHHEGQLVLSYSCFNCDKQIPLLPTQLVATLMSRRDAIPCEEHVFIPSAGAKKLTAADSLLTEKVTMCSPPELRKRDGGTPAKLEAAQSFKTMLEEYIFSPSSMEMALRCPLQFYYTYLLRARKPQYPSWKISEWLPSDEVGTLCHKVLELYFCEQMKARDMDAAASNELLKSIFDEEWERTKRRNPPAGRHEEQTRKAIWDMVNRAVAWTEQENRSVHAIEQIFGADGTLVLHAGKQQFKLQGKIDRVDQKPDGSYSVVDYKTGDPKRFERQQAYHLQHYLYKKAEEALSGGQIAPTEAGYLLLADEESRFFARDAAAEQAAEKAIEEMLTRLKADEPWRIEPAAWDVAEDGTLLPRSKDECEDAAFCSYRDLCPFVLQAKENKKNKKGGESA